MRIATIKDDATRYMNKMLAVRTASISPGCQRLAFLPGASEMTGGTMPAFERSVLYLCFMIDHVYQMTPIPSNIYLDYFLTNKQAS